MGVYHFMGLGLSVGAVTGPVSYLADRFMSDDPDDRQFFASSGERQQRQAGEKVGDIQAIVLFVSPEAYQGRDTNAWCREYILNTPGQCPPLNARREPRRPVREVVRKLLPKEWRRIAKGRPTGLVYWCELNQTDLRGAFERTAHVILAARSPGALGKEIWINLTGGNNVVNLALQLAGGLTGQHSRFYYVQAENTTAEVCVCHSRQQGYWVDLPLLPIATDERSRVLAEVVAESGGLSEGALLQQARQGPHWALFQEASDADLESFKRQTLRPLNFQGLVELRGDKVYPGRAWKLLQPYYETIAAIPRPHPNLHELTSEAWFHEEELHLS